MSKEKNIKKPRFIELEDFRKATNRKLWLGMSTLATVAVLSLGLALIAFARPIPVVVFDSQGRPILFEDTATPRQNLDQVRIEYFAEEFIRSYVGVDSAAVAEDLEKALRMMTPQFRQVVLADEDELARRKQYENQNIRSVISDWKVRVGEYDPAEVEGKIYTLVSGKMGFEPRFGELEEGSGEVKRWFVTQLVLQRVPVTKISIHGLMVGYCHTRFFDTKEDLQAHLISRKELS